MKVAVTGSSGLIGPALVRHLRSAGHEVVRVVRRPSAAPDEITWDPTAGTIDLDGLNGVDAVVNLAGAPVGDRRWTEDFKRVILKSRVDSTRTIATAMTRLDPKPRVLVSASAIGYYGETGDRVVDESDPPGSGYFADVVRAWEAAADPAREQGIRVVHTRSGIVVSRHGGAWGRMFPMFKYGIGGKLGSGRQYWTWISMRDELCAMQFVMEQEHLQGGVNLTSPTSTTNADIARVMGTVLGRPSFMPAPAFAIKAVLGDFSSEVLGSIRVAPTVLTNAGFVFQDPTIESAIRTALASD
jgi:uncharacterized protein (TIGR01777 family)